MHETMQLAGIHDPNFSVDILASLKAYENCLKKMATAGDKTCIIHVGMQTTNISIVKSGILIFTRSMQNDETKDLAANIVFETRRSLDYFLEQSGEDKVSRVLLSGGPSSVESIREAINQFA